MELFCTRRWVPALLSPRAWITSRVSPFTTVPPCPLPPGWPAPPAEYAIVYSLGVGGWPGFLLDAPASGADWSVLLPTFRLAGVRCGLRLGPGLQ